jgi:polysaccharide pyruvyl transferase WcaK-like protein
MSPHGGCYNHGCEAIVRSTIKILDIPKKHLFLYTVDIENDKKYGINEICNLVNNNAASIKINYIQNKFFAFKEKFFGGDRNLEEISYRNKVFLFDKKNTVSLSIGGDNYCYTGMQHILSEQQKLCKYNNIKSALWGCSIEKSLLTPKVINELKMYSLITVRESLSNEVLDSVGIRNDVISCSDPAFTLDMQETDWNTNVFDQNEIIGINVSDLMRHYDSYPDATYRNFYKLIEHILSNTNYSIVMIPHVIQKDNDDRIPIKKLLSQFSSNRIFYVDEDFNCMQLKYIISKCKMFIGCRTHSTIAAYSTCVPTLVVGYSTKARGICRDIFGSEKDLLIDARNFETDYDLTNKFIAFSEREHELRNHLEKVMPDYIKRAYAPRDAVLKLL